MRTSPHFSAALLVLLCCIPALSEAQDATQASTISSTSYCYCDEGTPGCVNNSCAHNSHCISEVVVPVATSSDEPRMRFLCGDPVITCAIGSFSEGSSTVYGGCCSNGSYCNLCHVPSSYPLDEYHFAILEVVLHENCTLPDRPIPTTDSGPTLVVSAQQLEWYIIVIIVIAVVVMVLALVMVGVIALVCQTRRKRRRRKLATDSLGESGEEPSPQPGVSITEGAGGLSLDHRSLFHDIKLSERIANGGYGHVYRALWKDKEVAVKVVSDRNETSWKKEQDIFESCMLCDDNIVKFFAVDQHPLIYGEIELWIVLEYCHQGSLCDFLRKRTVSFAECRSILLGIASGLAFLHMEFETGGKSKPGIAHRDLKTRNILMRTDGSCCITDFGLSVKNTEVRGRELEDVPNLVQGTKRYMAPEILDGSIHAARFEAYKRSDIYSFALVMWEVSRRCVVNGVAEDYQQPYFEYVTHDPTVLEMKQVVVDEKKRPSFEKSWKDNEFLQKLCETMRESWSGTPNARLSAHRIKKRILELYNDLDMKIMPSLP